MATKQHISTFSQFILECGCDGNVPDMGIDQGGTAIHDEVGGMLTSEADENHESEWKKITVIVKDRDETLEKLLRKIQELGNAGHSFEIVIDPEGEGDDEKEKIFWDGDGDDTIQDINVEDHDPEDDEFAEDDDETGEGEGWDEGDEENDEDDDEDGEEDDDDEEDTDESRVFEAKNLTPEQKEKISKIDSKIEYHEKMIRGLRKPGKDDDFKKIDEIREKIKQLRGERKKIAGSKKVDEKIIRQKNGSYPISGATSLRAAEHAYGRSKNKAKTKAHIKSAASELGLTKELGKSFKKK